MTGGLFHPDFAHATVLQHSDSQERHSLSADAARRLGIARLDLIPAQRACSLRDAFSTAAPRAVSLFSSAEAGVSIAPASSRDPRSRHNRYIAAAK